MIRDLLWYVDRLTRPIHDVVHLDSRDADGNRLVAHTDAGSLLSQLRDSVHGASGRHAGSGSGVDRMPFNMVAFELFERVEREITEAYAALTGLVPALDVEGVLRDWYLEHSRRVRAGRISLAEDDSATAWLRGWVQVIEDMFNPAVELELTVERRTSERRRRRVRSYKGVRVESVLVEVVQRVPARCPDCGARYGLDPRSGDQRLALAASYRSTVVAGVFTDPVVVCRSCEGRWEGVEAVSGLMRRIDEEEAV